MERFDVVSYALDEYAKLKGEQHEPEEEIVKGFLSDLRHYCRRMEIDIEDAIRISEYHFEEEK